MYICTVWPTADLKRAKLAKPDVQTTTIMLLFVGVWNSSKIKTHQGKEERSGLMKGQQIRYSMALNLSGSKPYNS